MGTMGICSAWISCVNVCIIRSLPRTVSVFHLLCRGRDEMGELRTATATLTLVISAIEHSDVSCLVNHDYRHRVN